MQVNASSDTFARRSPIRPYGGRYEFDLNRKLVLRINVHYVARFNSIVDVGGASRASNKPD